MAPAWSLSQLAWRIPILHPIPDAIIDKMIAIVKERIKGTLRPLLNDTFVLDLRDQLRDKTQVAVWIKAGKPAPAPEFVKRTTLAEFGAAFGLDTLIETGTFYGGALYALKKQFKTLYSIELSPELAEKAKIRFRRYPHIHILQGDSGRILPQLMADISTPCLFWLDGHYSSGVTAKAELDTPIVAELQTILGHSNKEHVILIDDARLFDGTHDYPTIDFLRDLLARERPDYVFEVVNDAIRAYPTKVVSTTY